MVDLTTDSPLTTAQPVKLAKQVESHRAVLEDTDNQIMHVQASFDAAPEPSEILDRPYAPLPRAPYHHHHSTNNSEPVTPITPTAGYVSGFALHSIAPAVLAADDASRRRATNDNHERHTSASESHPRSRHVAFGPSTDHSQRKDQEPREFSVSPQHRCKSTHPLFIQSVSKGIITAINKPESISSTAKGRRKSDFYGDDGRNSEPKRRSGDEMKDIEEVSDFIY